MTRKRGLFNIPANFEPLIAEPFDSRIKVSNTTELIDPTTFGDFFYKGMVVSVTDDTDADKNGIYFLKDLPYTNIDNWVFGSGGGSEPQEEFSVLPVVGDVADWNVDSGYLKKIDSFTGVLTLNLLGNIKNGDCGNLRITFQGFNNRLKVLNPLYKVINGSLNFIADGVYNLGWIYDGDVLSINFHKYEEIIDPDDFVLRIDTTKQDWGSPDDPTDKTVNLYLLHDYNVDDDFQYDFTIDWGDGNTESLNKADVTALPESFDWGEGERRLTHEYDVPGIYDIKISGVFAGFLMAFGDGFSKLLDIKQWGNIQWQGRMDSAFQSCDNLNISASDIPDFSQITSFMFTLQGCTSLQTIPQGLFDNAPLVTDFRSCFDGCTSIQSVPYDIITPQKHPLVDILNRTFRGLTSVSGDAPSVWLDWDNGNGLGFEGKSGLIKTQCFRNSNFDNMNDIPLDWK